MVQMEVYCNCYAILNIMKIIDIATTLQAQQPQKIKHKKTTRCSVSELRHAAEHSTREAYQLW